MVLRFCLLAALSLSICSVHPLDWTPPSTNEMRNLADFLEPFRKKLELPALVAAVVEDNQIKAAGAIGERKQGSGRNVTLADKFHIGSCTKSMTALLAVDLVRAEKVSLEARVGDVFPSWKLPAEKADITLELLLQNRSGIGNKPPVELWNRAFHGLQGDPRQQRREFLQGILAELFQASLGTKFIYSNLGFALAGAMLEEKANCPWEELMQERIFRPLQLSSAGFGPPTRDGQIENPWGHQMQNGVVTPIPPSDNPVAIAPAGLVHMSVLDLARYAAFHLDLFNGKVPEFDSYRARMYTAQEGSDYAFGWIVQKRKWAGGTVLTHSGSNTMFYTVIWIAPIKGYAFVVSTNIGTKDGSDPGDKCDQVVAALIKEFIN